MRILDKISKAIADSKRAKEQEKIRKERWSGGKPLGW